jgi:histidine triad (HIT) family protein
MKGCLFCSIANHKTPAKIQFENRQMVAFDDINPKAPVHILIVPKKHLENMTDAQKADRNILGEMLLTAKKLAQEKGIAESGYRLVINNKKHAGQIIDHIHMHLIGGRPLGPMA